MIQIIVQAQKASCRKSGGERITTGMVGKSISFDFDASWSGLVKTAIFEGSGVTKDVALTGDTAEIPHECLTVPGGMLSVGVFGTDGTMQTPTIYTDIGQIERGADPSGDESADPTLAIWAQLQSMMGDLGNLTTTARENLVAAINEAAKTGGGTAADVKMQVADGYIQYSTDGGANWSNLIAMSELIGPEGPAGLDGAPGADGADGEDGADGQDGVGIESVVQTTLSTEDSGTNVITVTKTDGTSSTFSVKNGSKGSTGDKGDKGDTGATGATGPAGADGKSAYQYAQDGGYTGTEAEFAAKLAEEMPDTLPNPNALTFTGAVTGEYDGSAPVSVEIPSGGGGSGGFEVLVDFTTEEAVTEFTIPQTVIGPIASKIKEASILTMQLSIPRDTTDESITTTGTVTIKAYVGWLTGIVGKAFNAIIAPSETYNAKWGKILFVTKVPKAVGDDISTCLVQICGKKNNSNPDSIDQRNVSDYFGNFHEKSYITVVGSQTMAAGTRFVMGVIA